MDCKETLKVIHEAVDGRLPPFESAGVAEHLRSCAACAAEEASLRRIGDLLRMWSASRSAEKTPQLDVLWTRVRAGMEEKKSRVGMAAWVRGWLWIPAAAAVLAVSALLFYPSGVSRAPFQPRSFEVAVEELESDSATVALVDRGEELPRVIWIIENEKT